MTAPATQRPGSMDETAMIGAAATMRLTRNGRLHIRRPRTTVRRPRAVSSPDALTIADRRQ